MDHSCRTAKAPNVVSHSQSDHEYRFPQFYLQRQCNVFAKLGLMGVTILYSAGNAGVAGALSGYCLDDNVKANASAGEPSEEVWNQDMGQGFFESGGGASATVSRNLRIRKLR